MLFDIVIPTYNNLGELKACLQGFELQNRRDFRAIVCVDGSTDGTLEYLKSADYSFPFLVLSHSNGVNKGRNPTRNLSLDYITAKYVLLFDSDLVPLPNLLTEHLNVFEKFGHNIISMGPIFYSDYPKNCWAQYINARTYHRYPKNSDFLDIKFFCSQNVAFPASHFTELKGQDAQMTTYGGGDTEFGLRMEKTFGVKMINNRKAELKALMNKDLEKALQQMYEMGRFNMLTIRRKHPEYKNIFHLNLLESPVSSWLIRLCFRTEFAPILKPLAKVLPGKLSVWSIRYLVIAFAAAGYFDGKKAGQRYTTVLQPETAAPTPMTVSRAS